jgi:hypothetical protein
MAADEHGNKEFMESFIKYVERNHQPTLFEIYGFSFINSKSEQLIQLADFICGTIAKGYQENQRTEKYNAFMKLLKPKIVGLKLWPETYKNYLLNTGSYEGLEYDEMILQQGIRLADLYMERYEASEDPEVQERILFLKFLKSMLYCQRPDQYVSTKEIIRNLSTVRRQKYSNHYFRTRIVAKLRDEGVIIASSPLGYKLPISQKELYDFVNQSFTVIMPMLSRLKKCREQIKAATKNELDILDKPEYEYLKKYFDDNFFNQGE